MSKELDYEFNNFANLLHKDCINLMECLKKQDKDNKPILYLGKHYQKVILPYEEYQKMCNRLESIDNANPSEALECVEDLIFNFSVDEYVDRYDNNLQVIKQALIQAEKEHNSVNLLMQELDCKDFADLRKYARCGYEKLNSFKGSKEVKIEIPESSLMDYNPVKNCLKWEDLEFNHTPKIIDVKMNGNKYKLVVGYNVAGKNLAILRNNKKQYYLLECDKQFFNDLHLERVEE